MKRRIKGFLARSGVATRTALAAALIGGVAFAGRTYLSTDGKDTVHVTTVAVTRGPIADEVSAIGTLQAVATVQVGTQISGTIAWLGADFNSLVHKGQVIARLEASTLDSQRVQAVANLTKMTADVERARMQLANAQQVHARNEGLWNKELISRSEFDASQLAAQLADAQVKSAEAQVSQASAALAQSEVSLTHAVITAPIDGIVIQRNVDVGQTVSASTSSPTIFAIADDLAHMRVQAGIDESDIANIRPNQPVTFAVDAYPNETFSGSVAQVRLEPSVVQNVTTYAVIVDVPNPDMKLRPGMTANVKIQIAKRDDVIRVPNAAVRFRPTPVMYAAIGQPVPAAPRAAVGTTGVVVHAVNTAATGASAKNARLTEATTASTIDALFTPLDREDTTGRVWIYAGNELKSVAVTLGVTDGQTTELVAGDLEPGAELVTNITSGEVRAAVAPTGGIFMQPSGSPRPGAGSQTGGRQRSS
jgi:HlyD family secretion protein